MIFHFKVLPSKVEWFPISIDIFWEKIQKHFQFGRLQYLMQKYGLVRGGRWYLMNEFFHIQIYINGSGPMNIFALFS